MLTAKVTIKEVKINIVRGKGRREGLYSNKDAFYRVCFSLKASQDVWSTGVAVYYFASKYFIVCFSFASDICRRA